MCVNVSATSSTRSWVKRCSFRDPVGPPSALAPLSLISRTSVSSSSPVVPRKAEQRPSVSASSPVVRRKASNRPTWASVWVRKPANTSIIRACSPRSSDGSSSHSGTQDGRSPSRVPSGTTPTSSCRAKGAARDGSPARALRAPGLEVTAEPTPGRGLLLVLDDADRPVGQVLGQVVALGRRARGVDEAVSGHQVGRPLVGVAAEEPVDPLEAEPQRPAVERARGALLPAGREVPLADGERAVARVAQDAGRG